MNLNIKCYKCGKEALLTMKNVGDCVLHTTGEIVVGYVKMPPVGWKEISVNQQIINTEVTRYDTEYVCFDCGNSQ